MSTQAVKLRNITTLITKGTTPTTLGHEFTDEGINFIKAEAVTLDGRIDESVFVHIDEATHKKLKRSQIEEGDILFSIAGMKLGKSAVVKRRHVPANTNQALAIIRADREKAIPEFLHYWFLNPEHYRYVNAITAQAAQPNINLAQVGDLPINLPARPAQRRIAGILSAYDELIENNQRRIKILEEMARSLYREWFVHFRFPGHDKVKMVPSALGPIPQGWEGCFGDIVKIDRDGINPFEFPGEEFEHFSIPSFDNGRQPTIEPGETILSGKYCVDASCVLLSKLNPRIPRIWLPTPSGQGRAITSTEFLVLKPQARATREFIYAKCCSEEFVGQFTSLAIGTSTSHQRVKPENLLTMPSTVPDQLIIERFSSVVALMYTLSQQLRVKTQNLRRTRDLLLPRLLSGQVPLTDRAA